jgi:hypothetical protein
MKKLKMGPRPRKRALGPLITIIKNELRGL